jgi:cytochrome c biogenesis protein CcmG, thiol:disulfide interchange protein DsbE
MRARRPVLRRAGAALLVLVLGGLGSVASAADSREPAPEIGRLAPDFTLPDLAGQRFRLRDLQGKRGVLLNFWATWCIPCREELPTLEKLARARAATLQVVGVNLDATGPGKVRTFARELGISFPVLLDPELAVGRLYRVRALPVTFIVDRTGVIRHREIGYRDWTGEEAQAIVDDALRPR